MRTKKSEPPKDKVVPSTDDTVLSSNETVSPIEKTELSPDDAASSNDGNVSPSDEIAVPTDETTSPSLKAIVPATNEAATSVNDGVPSDDEVTIPVNDVEPLTAENVAPIDAAITPSSDVVASPTDETASSPGEIETRLKETVPAGAAQQTWRAVVEPWWKATLAVLPTFLVTRFIFLLLSYFGGVLFFVKNYAATVIPLHDMIYYWDYWDAKRFATLATNGYVTPDYAAFFPLYPTLVHILTALTHRDVLAVSMFISNAAFLGMLIVLYRFVTVEFDKDTAKRTVLYISIFPTAIFFFAGYNESLFLFLTLLFFYTVRRRSWWLAGLFGLLATLTRSSGIFLALVFVLEYLRQNWPLLREEWQSKEPARMVRPLANLSAMLLIPLGLAIYSFALYRRFGDALAFIHAQSNWRQGLTFPLLTPLSTLKKIVTLPLFSFTSAHSIIDLTAAVLFTVLLAMCFVGPYRLKRSQWTLPLFGVLILITTMLYPNLPRAGGLFDPLASTQRLVLEAFVGFIILARLGRRPWFHQLYLLISLPMLAFLTLQFMTGHWTV